MPPPKKPKTGLTRVEEYLSEKDLEELKQRSSNDSGTNSGDERNSSPDSIGSNSDSSGSLSEHKSMLIKYFENHVPVNSGSQTDHDVKVELKKHEIQRDEDDEDVDIDVCSVDENNDARKTCSSKSAGTLVKMDVETDHSPSKKVKIEPVAGLHDIPYALFPERCLEVKSQKNDLENPKLSKLESLMMRRQVDSLMDISTPDVQTQQPYQGNRRTVIGHSVEPPTQHNSLAQESEDEAMNLSTKTSKNNSASVIKDTKNKETEFDKFKEREPKKKPSNVEDKCLEKTRVSIYSTFPSSSLSPMTSLEKMFYSNSKFYPSNGYNSPRKEISNPSRLPFVYQGYSNWHDLSQENNKFPHLATKPSLFLNSIQNINTAGATRPSTFQCEKALSSINDIKNISQQHAGLSVLQPKTHSDKQPEVTSSDRLKNYSKIAPLKEGGKNTPFLPTNMRDEIEKPPPLVPIRNILSSSKTLWKIR